MVKSLNRSWVRRVAGVSLVLLLAACSNDPKENSEVNGDEDYLTTSSLRELTAPQGITLPPKSNEYVIPVAKTEGALGKEISILPPKQTIQTASGTTTVAKADLSWVVQKENDETGLPRLIVRAPYNDLWKVLPDTLSQIGMEVTDRSGQKSTISVKYKTPDVSVWQKLGVKDPNLASGEYRLQLGDLDNRSSIQFLNDKDQPIPELQNDALAEVLQAALKQQKK